MNKEQDQNKKTQTGTNGVVTVNDDRNPTREQRVEAIRNEQGTERLRSERQSVQDATQKGESV